MFISQMFITPSSLLPRLLLINSLIVEMEESTLTKMMLATGHNSNNKSFFLYWNNYLQGDNEVHSKSVKCLCIYYHGWYIIYKKTFLNNRFKLCAHIFKGVRELDSSLNIFSTSPFLHKFLYQKWVLKSMFKNKVRNKFLNKCTLHISCMHLKNVSCSLWCTSKDSCHFLSPTGFRT